MRKIIALLLLLLSPLTGYASLITVSGTFAGANLGTSSSVDQISGSWSLIYDSDDVNLIGSTFLDPALTAFSLNPNPLGVTTFDLANTLGQLYFDNSALDIVTIGGVNAGAGGLNSGDDDFWAVYDGGSLDSLAWSLADEPGFAEFADEYSGSYAASSVPLPATVWLFGIGLVGLVARQRRG